MEIKTCLFFSFWAAVDIVFLKLGFNAFDATNISHTVSPSVMFFFNHAAAISVCHSSHYTFVYSPQHDIPDVREIYHLFLVFALTGPLIYNAIDGPLMWYLFPIWGSMVFFGYFFKLFFRGVVWDGVGFGIDFAIKMLLVYFGDNKKLVPILVLFVSWYTSSVWAAIFGPAEGTNRTTPFMLDVPVNILTSTIKRMDQLVQFGARILRVLVFQDENSSVIRRLILQKRRPLVEFAIGMVGTILFQNFFKITTFDRVLAFLYFAVMWLANLALLRADKDFGVLNFLLANVVVGCTVSEFEFRGSTWIAYGASVLLYGLRVELQSLSIVNRGENEARVLVW